MFGDCSTGCQNMMWLLVHDFGICENWGKAECVGTSSAKRNKKGYIQTLSPFETWVLNASASVSALSEG
jgi:hypothetical protein